MLIYLCAKKYGREAADLRSAVRYVGSPKKPLLRGLEPDTRAAELSCATAYSTATFAAARSTASAIPEVAASMFAEFIA